MPRTDANRDLAHEANLGLRPAVGARLGVPVRLMPLRARVEDIGVLTWDACAVWVPRRRA